MTEADSLDTLRVEIDTIDTQIVTLLARRMATAHRIAKVKQARAIPVRIPDRIALVIERAAALGIEHGLDPEYLRRLYAIVIEETCAVEERLLAAPADR